MNKFILIVLCFITIILQISLIPALHPLGVVPNLLLILVILLATNVRATQAIVSALIMGLSMDLASGSDFGLRMAFFCFTSIAIILLKQLGLNLNNFWLTILLVVILTILYDLSLIANLSLSHIYLSFEFIIRKIFAELIINLFVTICLFRPLRALSINLDNQFLLKPRKN